MPHVPRPAASTPAASQEQPQAKSTAKKPPFGMDKVSLRKHEVEPEAVAKIMFGKKVEIDDHTGELTVPRPGSRPVAGAANRKSD